MFDKTTDEAEINDNIEFDPYQESLDQSYTPSFNEEEFGEPLAEPDNIRFLQENKPEIYEFIIGLQRRIKNKNGDYYRPKGIEPVMNTHGIMDIYSQLSALLTKVISLGNIDKKEAYTRTIAHSRSNMIQLALNHKKYAIKKSDLDMVALGFETQVFSQLTRAIGQGERNLIRGIYKVNEQVRVDDAAQDKMRGLKTIRI